MCAPKKWWYPHCRKLQRRQSRRPSNETDFEHVRLGVQSRPEWPPTKHRSIGVQPCSPRRPVWPQYCCCTRWVLGVGPWPSPTASWPSGSHITSSRRSFNLKINTPKRFQPRRRRECALDFVCGMVFKKNTSIVFTEFIQNLLHFIFGASKPLSAV